MNYFTLKKVMKTCEDEKLHKTRARNVVKPPLNTAGPIVEIASSAFSCLVPKIENNYKRKIINVKKNLLQ